jgi:trehalose 6-phosphate synthase
MASTRNTVRNIHLQNQAQPLTCILRPGNGTYQPIHLLHCSVPFTELVALYAAADACLISSTRDGMNLVAYEYIASQTQRRGVLLLSEFAGAAEQMRGSLQFNPWDLDDMVGAIAEALTMGEEERATNHERAKAHVMANTSKSWGHSFVSDLERSASMSSMSLTNSMSSISLTHSMSSISSVASISSMSSVDDIVLKT